MKIRLVELVGPRCQGLDDGKKLYDLIFPEIKNGRSVELDFSDVELVFSPFLMGAIGKLLNHFEKDTIMQRLVLGPISEEHLKTVNDFLDRRPAGHRALRCGINA